MACEHDEKAPIKNKEDLIRRSELLELKYQHEKEFEKLKYEHRIKIMELESENKTKSLEMEKQIESLKHEIQIIKLSKSNGEGSDCNDESVTAEIPPFVSTTHRLVWGVEKFIQGKTSTWDLYSDYENWYDGISNLMHDRSLYMTKKFAFMRKNFGKFEKDLYFVSKQIKNTNKEENHDMFFGRELADESLWSSEVIFILLHPKAVKNCLEFGRNNKMPGWQTWRVLNIGPDFFWGSNFSAIAFCIF